MLVTAVPAALSPSLPTEKGGCAGCVPGAGDASSRLGDDQEFTRML